MLHRQNLPIQQRYSVHLHKILGNRELPKLIVNFYTIEQICQTILEKYHVNFFEISDLSAKRTTQKELSLDLVI